jgi:hypothetical protein
MVRGTVLALAACAIASGQGVPSEDDLVLLQPILERNHLGDGFEAYDTQGTVLVPLGELCRLLGFGITVDPERTVAAGFFIKPGRTFRLDLAAGTVVVEGRPAALGRALRMPRDIYVDLRSLEAWFPLKAEAFLKDSVVVITPRERLPIQDTWERDKKYGSDPVVQYGDDSGPKAPVRKIPYSFFSLPMADLNLGLTRTRNPAATTGGGSAAVGGDLLWMSADLNPSRDSTGSWGSSRYTLFREDPGGDLLGPLRGRSLDFGDLPNQPSVDLVGGLPQGRGANLDNYPVSYSTRFAARTFQGPLQPGWSVELFQNGTLVGFQRAGTDAQYLFKDVPLRFGVNLFRLVFHGPLGETSTKEYRLDITQNQPPPGHLYYGVSGIRPSLEDLPTLTGPGVTGAVVPPSNRTSYMARADYGLSTVFSAQASVSGMPLADGFHTYDALGLKAVWSFLALQGTAARDQGPNPAPGRAVEGILSTGTGYSTLTVRRDEFRDGFEQSPYSGTALQDTGQLLKDATEADLNWTPRLFGRLYSLTAQLQQEHYVGGGTGQREQFLASTDVGDVNLSNSLISLPGQPAPWQGSLVATSFAAPWGWSGNLLYNGSNLNGWGLQGQYSGPGGWQYQAGVTGPLGPADTPGHQSGYQYTLAATRLTGRYGAGLSLQGGGGSFSATLTLQVSLGREPRTGKWTTDAQSLATTGSVSAVAFLDNHGTGVRTPDDPVLEGTRFKVGDSNAPSAIKDRATTFITKLAKSQPVEIRLDESSLDDPALKPEQPGVTVVPRPGRTYRLEFPVAPFGIVDGTTRLLRDGKKEELPGLEVELVDAAGKRVKVMRSAYDGFFEFNDVPMGAYTLRVTPEEAARVKVKAAQRPVLLQPGHALLDGVDLVVEPMAPPTEAEPSPAGESSAKPDPSEKGVQQ